MNEEYSKFIQVKNSDERLTIINVDHIVSIKETDNGCIIKTTSSNYGIHLKMSIESISLMLPSVLKIDEINM